MRTLFRKYVLSNKNQCNAYNEVQKTLQLFNTVSEIMVFMLLGANWALMLYNKEATVYVYWAAFVFVCIFTCVSRIQHGCRLNIKVPKTHVSYDELCCYAQDISIGHVLTEHEDVVAYAKNIVERYLPSVPGVRLRKAAKHNKCECLILSDEDFNKWEWRHNRAESHYTRLAGLHSYALNLCLIRNGKYLLDTVVHELVHTYTNSEAECIYCTAYCLYLAGEYNAFVFVADTMQREVHALALMEKLPGM